MKTNIFINAIRNRLDVRFLYCSSEIMLEPYYITRNRFGRKVIYGRVKHTKEIRKFEFYRIANIHVVESVKFSPLIPLAAKVF